MSETPGGPRDENVRYRAQQAAEKRDHWFTILLKVIAFLVLGTIGLGVLFFGTCVLLMRH